MLLGKLLPPSVAGRARSISARREGRCHRRQRDQQCDPQADPERAPHHARIARAERLGGQQRHGRDQSHSKVKLTKNTVCASDAAATASLPRRPMKARSVVIIAICPGLRQCKGRGEAKRLQKLEKREMVARRACARRRDRRSPFHDSA